MSASLEIDLSVQDCLDCGTVMVQRAQSDKAEWFFRRGLDIEPKNPHLLSNLGGLIGKNKDSAAARSLLWQAILQDPQNVSAWSNLGVQEHRRDRFVEARASLEMALKYKPDSAEVLMNLATNSQYMGKWEQALQEYWQADKFKPNSPDIRASIGMIYMLLGDFDRGLPLYDARHPMNNPWPSQEFPRWDGERLDLDGKKILLCCEQGIGDSIQFIRYAQALRKAAPKVKSIALFCPDKIRPLMELWPGVDQFYSPVDVLMPWHDMQIPLLSMPRFMRMHGFDRVAPVVAPKRVDLGPKPKFDRPQVGLCWRGNPGHVNDRYRSIKFDLFQDLMQELGPAVNFVSLQMGMTDVEKLCLLPYDPASWNETVYEIENLDLVITCDTAIAHLAGMIGVQTWLLTPANGDWRWTASGETTEWYPSMRIFRQDTMADWEPVFFEVAKELGKVING